MTRHAHVLTQGGAREAEMRHLVLHLLARVAAYVANAQGTAHCSVRLGIGKRVAASPQRKWVVVRIVHMSAARSA